MINNSQLDLLSANLSRVIKQLVVEGMTIYAYHWDPPELDLYLGDENPHHIRVNQTVMDHASPARMA